MNIKANYNTCPKDHNIDYQGKAESFYRLFDYSSSLLDGGDQTMNFELVTITRDIPSLKLVKGAEYEVCWFDWKLGVFQFINWRFENPNHQVSDWNKSFKVNQFELAPYMLWDEEDFLKAMVDNFGNDPPSIG